MVSLILLYLAVLLALLVGAFLFLKRSKKLIPYVALKHIGHRPLQSRLTIAGVAIGVAALIVALSLTNGFIDELIRSTLKATPHITLSPFDSQPFAEDAALMLKLEQEAQVSAVSPFLSAQALIARRANATLGITGRRGYVQLFGIDPDKAKDIFDLAILHEQKAELLAGDTIVLGSSLAHKLGVYQGDEVFIRDIDGKSRTYTVIGTFNVGNEIIDGVVAYVSLASLQDYMRLEGDISGYHISLDKPEAANTVALNLTEASGLWAASWQSIFATLIQQLRLQKILIAIVIFLIVIVAVMGIANILILTVAEKTEEIAILRALGTSQKSIVALFTLEGLILGGTGTLLGAIIGLAASLYLKLQPYPLPGDLYYITQLPVELQLSDFIAICTAAILASVIAGTLPAKRASALDPAVILR